MTLYSLEYDGDMHFCRGRFQHDVFDLSSPSERETTRNSSGDEIANLNFFTTTSLTTFTQCARKATEFGEITQSKGHYAVQGHSRSQILVPIESSCTTSN